MQTTTPHAQRPAVASSKFINVSRACGVVTVGKAKPTNTASVVCLGSHQNSIVCYKRQQRFE